MQRIHLPNTPLGKNISLQDSDIYHQLIRVLRSRVGDTVVFFDGVSQEDFIYEIDAIEKKSLNLIYIHSEVTSSELNFDMHLYQALPNSFSKIEYIIQKCTEVGYKKIHFFRSERSQKLNISESKIQRLQSIAKESTEQSGRNIVPEIILSDNYTLEGDIQMIFHTVESSVSKNLNSTSISSGQTVDICVGPEGGFTDEEIEKITTQNTKRIFLGNRILRCETVGPVTGFFLSQNNS